MPRFTIQRDDGKTITLEGDVEPSPDEFDEIFAQADIAPQPAQAAQFPQSDIAGFLKTPRVEGLEQFEPVVPDRAESIPELLEFAADTVIGQPLDLLNKGIVGILNAPTTIANKVKGQAPGMAGYTEPAFSAEKPLISPVDKFTPEEVEQFTPGLQKLSGIYNATAEGINQLFTPQNVFAAPLLGVKAIAKPFMSAMLANVALTEPAAIERAFELSNDPNATPLQKGEAWGQAVVVNPAFGALLTAGIHGGKSAKGDVVPEGRSPSGIQLPENIVSALDNAEIKLIVDQAINDTSGIVTKPVSEVVVETQVARSNEAAPSIDFARAIADMTPDEFFNKAQSFNKVNLELGRNATPEQITELTALRDKAVQRVEAAKIEALKPDATDAVKNDYLRLSTMPQFFNEAIAENARNRAAEVTQPPTQQPESAKAASLETPAPTAVPREAVTPDVTNVNLNDIYQIFEPEPKKTPTLKERASNLVESVRTGFSSKFRPVNKLAEDISKAYGTTQPKDIAGIMEQLKGSQGKGEAQIYRFDRDVSKLVEGSEKDFNAYMFIRRSLDRLNQDAADIAKAQAGESVPQLNRRAVADYTIDSLTPKLAALEAKIGPEKLQQFQVAADGYQRYMDDALRLQVESGRMSLETYNEIKAGNQFYAPFKVMKYLEESSKAPGSGRRIDTQAEYTKAMKGIESPDFKLGDMLGAARQSILISRILADKNAAMRNVAELAPFDVDGNFIKKLGKNEEAPKGWQEVNVLENGETVKYATNPDVAEAIQLYGDTGSGMVSKILGVASIPFKAGATALNIPFQISNLLADTPRAALISKYGLRGAQDLIAYPLKFVESLFSSIKANVFGVKNQLYQDFLDSGVAGGTVQEMLTPESLKFQEPTEITKSQKLAKSVISTLPNFAKAIEETSKILGVQRAIKFEGVQSGVELAKQVPRAITELRRFSGSPDFGRQGKIVEQARLNLLYMFLNARIQGTVADLGRLTGRDGGKTAARTWAKVGYVVGVPTAYLWYLNNRPEYKEDYDKRPKQEKQNYWLIPKDTYITNDNGEKMRDYWRIPKRESAKWLSNLAEAALKFADTREPEAAKQFGIGMMEDISPVNIEGRNFTERLESIGASLNPILKAPLELATERDMYRHKDIIQSDQMKRASPEQQYTDRTAEAFKKLAEWMPDASPEFLRSPLRLENLTRNLTAGLVTQFIPRKPVEGRTDIENNPLLARFQALPMTEQAKFREDFEQLQRNAADEQLARHRQADKLIRDNKGKDLAQIVDKLPEPRDEKLIRQLVDLHTALANGITAQEKQVLSLPPRQRAIYVATKLQEAKPEQRPIIYDDLVKKRIITLDVAQELPNELIP